MYAPGINSKTYESSQSYRYDSDSSQQYSSKYHTQNTSYNDSYSQLESPEKVNSLERNKHKTPPTNTYDSPTYGYGAQNTSDVYAKPTPAFATSSPYYNSQQQQHEYVPYSSSFKQEQQQPTTGSTYFGANNGSHYSIPKPYVSNTSPKPFGIDSSKEQHTFEFSGAKHFSDSLPKTGTYTKFDAAPGVYEPPPKFEYKNPVDGYTTSESGSTTYKIPGGTKTETYKYESYQSAPQPVYSTSTEKYFTSTPNSKLCLTSFEPLKNGSDVQSSYSSNVEYVTQPGGSDSLEQKMLKKSVTQQVIEKKTVSMTKTSKQESSTKNFRLE